MSAYVVLFFIITCDRISFSERIVLWLFGIQNKAVLVPMLSALFVEKPKVGPRI